MRARKQRTTEDFSFFNPEWRSRVAGLAASVWTAAGSLHLPGRYVRLSDTLLWTLDSRGARPILACRRPRIEPYAATAVVPDYAAGSVWDLSDRETLAETSPGTLDHLAAGVANLLLAAWPKAAADVFRVPHAYVGYVRRVPLRKTRALAERIGDDDSGAALSEAWERVPTVLREPGGATRFLYPAAFVSGVGFRAGDVHPETGEARPESGPAAGWTSFGGDLIPEAPEHGVMFGDFKAVCGATYANQAMQAYKKFAMLPPKTHEDDAAVAEAVALFEGFDPTARLTLAEDLRSRLPRRVKFTQADLMDALANPRKPVVASTFPRVVSFAAEELDAPFAAGWSFGVGASAAVDARVAVGV